MNFRFHLDIEVVGYACMDIKAPNEAKAVGNLKRTFTWFWNGTYKILRVEKV